jgi:hypothetical protein
MEHKLLKQSKALLVILGHCKSSLEDMITLHQGEKCVVCLDRPSMVRKKKYAGQKS